MLFSCIATCFSVLLRQTFFVRFDYAFIQRIEKRRLLAFRHRRYIRLADRFNNKFRFQHFVLPPFFRYGNFLTRKFFATSEKRNRKRTRIFRISPVKCNLSPTSSGSFCVSMPSAIISRLAIFAFPSVCLFGCDYKIPFANIFYKEVTADLR